MLKKTIPHILAVVLFAIVSMFYFAPQYSGKDVKQFDNIQANGTRASIESHQQKYGEHPQWIDNMFGGMPSYSFDMESVSQGIFDPLVKALNFIGRPASSYMLLMLGFYFMALCFGINPYIAIVGSLAWGLSSYFYIIYVAGHIMKLIALTYIAPLIGSIYYAYHKNLLVGGALAALFAVLEIKSVHPQITYYFLFVIVAMTIGLGVMAFKQGEIKRFLLKTAALMGFALLAVGSNAVYLYFTYDYMKDSTRGTPILVSNSPKQEKGLDRDYITAYSYGKAESFNMLVPNLMGGTSQGGFSSDGELNDVLGKLNASELTSQIPAYWGNQPITLGPVYIGAVVIFLFVLGLFLVRGYVLWWIVSVSLLALFLAWGENMMWFTDLFIDYFPLYNKFRTVSMILVILEFTFPLFAMFTLQKIVSEQVSKERVFKALKYSLGILGGILVIFMIFGEVFFTFSSLADTQYGLPDEVLHAMQSERSVLMIQDSFRSLFFVVATAAAVWLLLKNRKAGVASIALLVILDLVPIDQRYLNNDHFVSKKESVDIPITPIDKAILQDTTNYRVANMTLSIFNDATTSKYHRSIGGYSAVKPRRYQDMIDYYLGKGDINLYNMWNTKYFIVADSNNKPTVQLNPNALGSAWIVDKLFWVDSPNQEIESLANVDLAKTAVVDAKYRTQLSGVTNSADSTASVTQTQYRANRWVFKANSAEKRLVVISEPYYDRGWSVTVNGEKVDPLRVNYALFAVVIPEGQSEIIFEFSPPNLAVVDTIAVCCSVLIIVLLIGGAVFSYRNRESRKKALTV